MRVSSASHWSLQDGKRGSTYNTDDGAVLGDIVRLDLLDEAQREDQGKEPDQAQAEGPAPRSTFHVESFVCKEGKKNNLLALLLAGGRRVKEMKRGEGVAGVDVDRARSLLEPILPVTEEEGIRTPAAVWCEVVGGTGEESKRRAKSNLLNVSP